MLRKDFLLAQHGDWLRHLANLNAELNRPVARDRAATLVRAGKAADWLAHYARLLRDGHGVRV
jgi:hypothetical protein